MAGSPLLNALRSSPGKRNSFINSLNHIVHLAEYQTANLKPVYTRPLCVNIDVASNEEAEHEIFESPEGEHSEKGNAA
jgi:hypothetical protein